MAQMFYRFKPNPQAFFKEQTSHPFLSEPLEHHVVNKKHPFVPSTQLQMGAVYNWPYRYLYDTSLQEGLVQLIQGK